MTPDEDRIEGGLYDRAYDDHIDRMTDPELLHEVAIYRAFHANPQPQPMRLCRSCGKRCPDGAMRGHICWECDFMFGNVMDEKLKRER